VYTALTASIFVTGLDIVIVASIFETSFQFLLYNSASTISWET
jgi:hypothetical protein